MTETIIDIATSSENNSPVSEIPKEIRTHFAVITLRSDKIVRVDFKADVDFDIEDAKLLYEVLKSFYKGDKLLVLINTGEGVMISNEARKFTASDDVSTIVKADAVVVNNLATRILIRPMRTFYKIQRMMELFHTEREAISWLKNISENCKLY